MGAYDRDPRVRRVNRNRYEMPDPKGEDHWVVEYHGPGDWRAFATHGHYTNPPYWQAETADQAIAMIIGEPQNRR